MNALWTVARQTFRDVLRQPAQGVVLLIAMAVFTLSPRLSLFALSGEQRLLKDFGVSTLLLVGLLFVSLASSSVVRLEIENRTVLSLLAKPLSRASFLVGKFLGLLMALAIGMYPLVLALLLADRYGPALHSHQPADGPVLVGGIGALGLSLVSAGVLLLVFERPFFSSWIYCSCITLTAGLLFASFWGRTWDLQPYGAGFDFLLPRAAILALIGLATLAAFTISVSVWVGRGGALILTILFYLGGLSVGALEGSARWALFFLPNFQIFWVGDLFYFPEPELPWSYLAWTALYSTAHVVAYLGLGVCAFRKRGL